ncbi:hypothetical protein MRS44_003872 [Fusarium solani]|uniref:uncharacterized protein n=1 Tax=Fusarium solani TaxID=169388 RepID=UPI0032C45D8A|nr:hypothetical protein MRS44_003872 [Fusarium solani]
MSNGEAYLQIPDPREGRGPRKRGSETILNTRRSKSPRQARTDDNERADDNKRADEEVDHTPLAKSLQSAPLNNDEHLVSKEPEQDGSHIAIEDGDEAQGDDILAIWEQMKVLRLQDKEEKIEEEVFRSKTIRRRKKVECPTWDEKDKEMIDLSGGR